MGAHPYFLETPNMHQIAPVEPVRTWTRWFRRVGSFAVQPAMVQDLIPMGLWKPSPWLCLPLHLDDFFLGGLFLEETKTQRKMRPFGNHQHYDHQHNFRLWYGCMLTHVNNTVLKVTRTLMDPNLNLRYHLCRKSWGIDGGRSSEMPWKKCQPQGCGCGPSQDSIKHIVLTWNDMKWHENNTMHVIDAYLILYL